jgi:hypothetical protein
MDTVAGQVEMPPDALKHVVNPWLLGADPEFAVLTPPDVTVPNAGVHAVEHTCEAGSVGWDHDHRVWELRPSPSTAAYGVLTNIWKLLRLAQLSRVEGFKWKSGALGGLRQAPHQQLLENAGLQAPPATPDTLGGHVHFGIQNFNAAQLAALREMTRTLLTLDILPEKENTIRLRGGRYGNMQADAVRTVPDNGGGHCEWRPAPSWLDRPGQALAALTCFKLAGARPSTVDWTTGYNLKGNLLRWLEEFAAVDVDAFLLDRFIARRGFDAVQADPASDFKPRWRRENLWAK